MDGKMLFYNAEGDYGFIRTEEGERIAVNRTGFVDECPQGRIAGKPVTLVPVETAGGRIATQVVFVEEKVGNRARRRSH